MMNTVALIGIKIMPHLSVSRKNDGCGLAIGWPHQAKLLKIIDPASSRSRIEPMILRFSPRGSAVALAEGLQVFEVTQVANLEVTQVANRAEAMHLTTARGSQLLAVEAGMVLQAVEAVGWPVPPSAPRRLPRCRLLLLHEAG